MNTTATQSKLSFWGLVFICFASLIALLFMSGVGKAQHNQADVVSVSVEATSLSWQTSFKKIQRVVGRVESSQRANAGFELAGAVSAVYVDDGDTFSKGQVLAKLDTELLESQLRQANASVERSQAQARLAQSSINRIQDLVSRGVESQQRLDEAQQGLDAALASVKEAKARAQTIAVNIQKSELRAPFAGEVVARLVDTGTVVGQGRAMFELIANEQNDVRLPMPADLIKHLNVGEDYVLRAAGQDYPAQLKSIGKERRLATRTIDAVFQLVDSELDSALLPGDLMTLDVTISVSESGVWVPVAALSHGVRGLWNVYTVDDTQVSQVTPRAVEVLYSDGQFAFIRGAIAPDMLVVVSGTHRLAPGQEVAVKPVSSSSTAELQQ